MSESRNLSSQSQAMMSLNLQLRSTVMKSQAKAIDLDLRKLDAAQATERLNYVQVRSFKIVSAVATTSKLTLFIGISSRFLLQDRKRPNFMPPLVQTVIIQIQVDFEAS